MIVRTGSTAQRLSETPYEKRLCRIEHYPTCLDLLRTGDEQKRPGGSPVVTMEEEIQAIHDAGTEVWAISGTRSTGFPHGLATVSAFSLSSSNATWVPSSSTRLCSARGHEALGGQ